MTPMEAQAQAGELVAKINGQRSRIAGGYDISCDEPGPVVLIAAALTDAYAQGRRAGLVAAAMYAEEQADISSGFVASAYMIVSDWCSQSAQEEKK